MNYKKISENNWEINYIFWLGNDVLVVACVNKKRMRDETPEWAAYVGSVLSEQEWERVAKNGSKLPKKIAEAIFPFSKTHRWRA